MSPIISRHPAQEDGSLIHVVRPGQTLFSIARAYGVPMQDLIRRNRLEPGGAWLLSGQVLVIRDAPTPDDAGDADYADDADDADAASLDECDSIIHVVQRGETIYSIAQAYDVHPRHLAIRNQLPYGGNRLHSGQQLVIPDVTSPSGRLRSGRLRQGMLCNPAIPFTPSRWSTALPSITSSGSTG